MKNPSKQFLDLFKSTPGAISVCEAIAIFNLAKEAPAGHALDLGSNAGKAAMAAAYGLQNTDVIRMVDPIFDMENRRAFLQSVQQTPENVPWAWAKESDFKTKVRERILAVSEERVKAKLIGDASMELLKRLIVKVGYCFIDTDDHQLELVMAEVKELEDRMVEGGIIAFHDFGNQYHGPKEAHKYLIGTGKYEDIKINWEEIVEYVKEKNLEKGNDSWHAAENPFPCFVGAVRRIGV